MSIFAPDRIEIPERYLPEGVTASSFDPAVLRAAAEAWQRGHVHDMEVKSWVVLWLLDHVTWPDA